MLSNEILQDIPEDAASELGDNIQPQEYDLEDELESTIKPDSVARNVSSRVKTTKSGQERLPGEEKSSRPKKIRPRIYDFSASNLKRDIAVEAIIESRKATIIENDYTVLAQMTSQGRRQSHYIRINSLKPQTSTMPLESGMQPRDAKSRATNSRNDKNPSKTPTLQFDSEKWEDGLNTDFDKMSIASSEKPSVQVYEERCTQLNICPSSMVIRSLNTSQINLENYGLGPKGAAALAVALIRNTTVTSLNLSGNDIGNSGMSHIYHIIVENSYIEEYNLSNNHLGTKGIRKLAAAVASAVHIKALNIAGNDLVANDIKTFFSKLEDRPNLIDLNISHNQLGEDGAKHVAEWISDNNVLLNLDVSWCSIRLSGATALAKAVGDNNKLLSLNLSNNSFGNDTVEILKDSLSRNVVLKVLDLSSNQMFCRHDSRIEENPKILITGSEASIYRLFSAAMTSHSLKIFRVGKNHLDTRCIMIILKELSEAGNILLEELDLTGLTLSWQQVDLIHSFFKNYPNFNCFVGSIKQAIEPLAHNLLNEIRKYCEDNEIELVDLFMSTEENSVANPTVTYDEFLSGLRRAKIPFPVVHMNKILNYLGQDSDPGTIALSLLDTQ